VETLTGSFVRSRIISGEPIRDENLAPLNAALSATLPSGTRIRGQGGAAIAAELRSFGFGRSECGS
jgi:Flp pilus assembly protein CpaB